MPCTATSPRDEYHTCLRLLTHNRQSILANIAPPILASAMPVVGVIPCRAAQLDQVFFYINKQPQLGRNGLEGRGARNRVRLGLPAGTARPPISSCGAPDLKQR